MRPKTLKKLIVAFVMIISLQTFAQVGIETTNPNAMLDVRASNALTPENTDGLLIPRIDTFPATNPTAAQDSMIVYLTTVDGTDTPGFYYWNQATTSWISLLSAAKSDADWFVESSTNSPDDITDNIFTEGFVGIGKNNPTTNLDVQSTAATTTPVLRVENSYVGSTDTRAFSATANNTDGYGIAGEFEGGYKSIVANNDGKGYSNTYGIDVTSTGTTGTRTAGRFNANGGTTNIAGEFRVPTGANNYALKIVDGNQGVDKILTSDAAGNARWKDAAIDNIVYSNGVAPLGVDVPYNTSIYLQTGSTITLPPGKFAVNVTMLITESIPFGAFVLSPDNSQFWIRSSFSDVNTANPPLSPDLEGTAKLVSGSLNGSSYFGLVTGTVIINNTSGANKTYYYIAGGTTIFGTNRTIKGFGGAWAEDNIIAYRLQ